MSLVAVQKDVDNWVSQFSVNYWSPHEILARLTEEVGELAREVNHLHGPKQKKKATKELGEEIGDIIFTVCCLANSQEIDLDAVWKQIMNKCYKRDNKRFKKYLK